MRRRQHVQRVFVLAEALTLLDDALKEADEGRPRLGAALEEAHTLADEIPGLRHHLLAERDHAVAAGVELDLLARVGEAAIQQQRAWRGGGEQAAQELAREEHVG